MPAGRPTTTADGLTPASHSCHCLRARITCTQQLSPRLHPSVAICSASRTSRPPCPLPFLSQPSRRISRQPTSHSAPACHCTLKARRRLLRNRSQPASFIASARTSRLSSHSASRSPSHYTLCSSSSSDSSQRMRSSRPVGSTSRTWPGETTDTTRMHRTTTTRSHLRPPATATTAIDVRHTVGTPRPALRRPPRRSTPTPPSPHAAATIRAPTTSLHQTAGAASTGGTTTGAGTEGRLRPRCVRPVLAVRAGRRIRKGSSKSSRENTCTTDDVRFRLSRTARLHRW